MAAGVYAQLHMISALINRQDFARVNKRGETGIGAGSGPGETEFYVASSAAGFGAGPEVANGHGGQSRAVIDEEDLSKILICYSADLAL
jgi:hypothetical protein